MCECSECGETKARVSVGWREGEKRRARVFADERGRKWNGRSCPDCLQDRVGVRRQGAQPDLGPSTPLYAAKQRPCKDCGGMSANYYRCPPCTTLYMSNNDGLFYGALDEEMFNLDTGQGRLSGLKAGFHY